MGSPDIGSGAFAQIDPIEFAFAFGHHALEKAKRVGLKGLELIGSGLKRIRDNVDAHQTREIHVAVGQGFIKGEVELSWRMNLYTGAKESHNVCTEVGDLEFI